MQSADVRRQFIEFFEQKHAHRFVPSSPVVPRDDPTLLFANAGMNQFKPIFLGEERRDYTRAVNSQKCIRAGGKHNDLDDVGRDTYHHTFFEMLGNWSFGDYFKAEAIAWAWELLTEVWKLDPQRLHATYFEGDAAEGLEPDSEAKQFWLKLLPPDHVHPGNKKDNFWEMGDTGPCGPCSEIHYDRSDDKSGGPLVNADDQDVVVEIWNLVFIQYNRTPAGLKPLPAKHVDTGMGFERVVRILQGKTSNYETDVFLPILDKIAELTGKTYTPKLDDPVGVAFRAVADHVRMATFAITDGARPGPNKADSVLRSVLRRASRYGYTVLEQHAPFLHKVVPTVVEQMGGAFPELRERQKHVAEIVEQEESDFLKAIDRGLGLYAEAADRAKANENRFSGEDLFELHTTYGFPPDMTMQLARDDGFEPDVEDYQRRFKEFQDKSRGDKMGGDVAVDFGDLPDTDDAGKYDCPNKHATLVGFLRGDTVYAAGTLNEGDEASLLLDKTCFYAEQGGQVGDTGTVRGESGEFEVMDTTRRGNRVLHHGRVTCGRFEVGDAIETHVNNRRRAIVANHTATHLMNLALKQVLGEHVEQRGSLVDDMRTRFDFSHNKALDAEEIAKVERRVNGLIADNLPVRDVKMPLAEAKNLTGVRAVFGEKYPDPVRVVFVTPGELSDGDGSLHSIEFCGGVHAKRTGDLGFFKIVAEESVSKGVRRITAVTGGEALAVVQKMETDLKQIGQALSAPAEEAPARVLALREEIKSLKKKLATGGGGAAADPSKLAADLLTMAETRGGVTLIVAEVADGTDEQLRQIADVIKSKQPNFAVMLATAGAEKVSFVAACGDAAVSKGLKAGDWVRETSKVAGGGGGGRPNLAQAGGKLPDKIGDALDKAREVAAAALG